MVQCSRNWMMSPNIIILVWVTKTSIDHWFIHMLLIVDWLIHICNWLLIGLFITLLMGDWFIYYTTYGWLVYLLRYWLTIGFQDLERVEERHLFMSRVKKKKITTLLEQNCRILLHLFICGNFEHNFIFICFKNNQGLFSYFRLDHESVV